MAERIGQYRLIRVLGYGSFGEVYLGEHVHKHTLAAVKLLQARLTPEDMKEFINEASTTFRLHHPNIVQLLDFGLGPDNTPFLAMAYAPNGTLRQRHPKGTRLPLETIIAYVKPIAAALQHAHDERLIHRDVKQENILLGPNNEVWLSDFGITSLAHSSRSLDTEKLGGTIPYMAPEQIQGKPRPASDQYALGIMVYEWLSGDRPFRGSSSEIAVQHTITPPPPLREKLPTILPDVEQVVMMALAKDPKQRFASVQAFAKTLEQASQADAATFVKPPMMQPLRTTIPPDLPPTLPVTPPLPPKQPAADIKPVGTVICTYRGHSYAVEAVAWSPDGRRIASGSADGTVQVWDAASGSALLTYRGHATRYVIVFSVAWSPDGRHIASAGGDKTVQVWDAASGTVLLTYRGHSGSVCAVAWSPDGSRLASGSWDKTVQVWDAASGSALLTYHGHEGLWKEGAVHALAWSPDGSRLASGSRDKTVQVWDAASGSALLTYHGHEGLWKGGAVFSVAWSPDGRHIASGSHDNTVQVWDASSGTVLLTYRGHSYSVFSVAWSPDGQRIASGSHDNTVQVWDAANGGHVFTYRGHFDWVNAVAWSPDGQRVVLVSNNGTVQVWQAG